MQGGPLNRINNTDDSMDICLWKEWHASMYMLAPKYRKAQEYKWDRVAILWHVIGARVMWRMHAWRLQSTGYLGFGWQYVLHISRPAHTHAEKTLPLRGLCFCVTKLLLSLITGLAVGPQVNVAQCWAPMWSPRVTHLHTCSVSLKEPIATRPW